MSVRTYPLPTRVLPHRGDYGTELYPEHCSASPIRPWDEPPGYKPRRSQPCPCIARPICSEREPPAEKAVTYSYRRRERPASPSTEKQVLPAPWYPESRRRSQVPHRLSRVSPCALVTTSSQTGR